MAYATLTTALAGTNNDLVYTAKIDGSVGALISVEYIDPGGVNKSLDIDVDGLAIKAWLATDAVGAITTTGDLLKAAIAAHPVASNLVEVTDAGSNDGSGVLTAMAAAYLSGTASAATSYATVAQLREYLKQAKTGAATDSELQNILDRATAIIDGALGFSFAAYPASASARDVRGVGGVYLELPAYQAGSITSIYEVSDRGTSDESTTLVSDWLAEETFRPYQVYRHSGWNDGAWYRVTAKWGYGAPPADIVEVTLEVAVNIWRAKDASFGQSELGVQGGGSVSYNRALTWGQRSIIEMVRTAYLGIVYA